MPVPLAELPAELRGQCSTFDDIRLAAMPWAHRAIIPRRSTPPPRPTPPTAWPPGVSPPATQRAMLEPGIFEEVFKLLEDLDAHHCSRGALRRPGGKAWGLESFRKPYRDLIERGAVFDWTTGACLLVGGDAPEFTTHVSPEQAAEAFKHSVDREAAQWWQTGVAVKAYDRQPGIHISHNLMSTYPDAVGPIATQVDDFRTRGWNATAPLKSRAQGSLGLPQIPFGSHPLGGVEKRGTPEPRVINAVGWPPDPFPYALPRGFIGPPNLFVSTNSLGGSTKPDPGDPYPPFLREHKSTISDAALNTCIVGHVCMLAGYALFELAFDFEKWFHQFFYVKGEAWLMGGLVSSHSGPTGELRVRSSSPS